MFGIKLNQGLLQDDEDMYKQGYKSESRYCNAVDNLDFEKFNEENKEELEKELSGLDSRKPKYPSKQEVREIMGYTESDEGKLYIVSNLNKN